MMTNRRWISSIFSACIALACLPLKIIDVMVATWRDIEDQGVAMTRLELTLAQWQESLHDAFKVLRPDMRASGNGAVFNDMPSQLTMRSTI